MGASTATETLGFQAEVKQLLQLMIHSLYSNREIFLRELISNASDACDKLRFAALSDTALAEHTDALAIELSVDADARTLTITDNGIGMSRDEIVANLGTIARSGTAEFISQLSGDEAADAQLIGQFGVGFYSAFIVADRVEVISRRAGEAADSATHWESAGDGEFTVAPTDAPHGTKIVLHMKTDADEYLDEHRLRALVRRYSDHIAFPVVLLTTVSDEDSEEETETESRETLNSATALWTRSRSEVKDEEYTEFYKHLTHDFGEPLAHSHNRVEGKREYTSLMYIPARAPFDLWNRESPRGLKLYVQRVFIMDDAEAFLPLYLRFVRGVVDANDLPLNVSRELLQASDDVDAMRSALTRRVLDMLGKLAKDDADKYRAFWEEFGEVLKEGLAEDMGNRDRVAGLLRFTTSTSADDALVSLDDYIARAKEDQDRIYYLTADSLAVARRSPHLEVFKERGVEVLLLTGRLDEWTMGHLPEYDGKALTDISRAGVELPGEAAPEIAGEEDDGEHKGLMKKLRQLYKDDVDKVRISRRLVSSPAVLVTGENAISSQMRRLLEAAGQHAPDSQPELELNPGHPLCRQLDAEEDEQRFEDLARVLLDQARLAAGDTLPDPGAYIERVQRLLAETQPATADDS